MLRAAVLKLSVQREYFAAVTAVRSGKNLWVQADRRAARPAMGMISIESEKMEPQEKKNIATSPASLENHRDCYHYHNKFNT
jgi:hypothetical protein